MVILSLFNGIGVGVFAAEQAGLKIDQVYYSEICPHANQVFQKHYPNAINLGDVRNIDLAKLPPIDLFIAGFPCQSFSSIGEMQGFDCENGGLALLTFDLLRKIKPKHFILENVASMSFQNQSAISTHLAVQPIMLNAAAWGAQSRERLFWTNICAETHYDLFGNSMLVSAIQCPRNCSTKLVEILDYTRPRKYLSQKAVEGLQRRAERANHLFPYFQNNGKAKTILATYYKGSIIGQFVQDDNGISWLSPIELERLQSLPDDYTAGISYTQRGKVLGNAFDANTIKFLLSHITT